LQIWGSPPVPGIGRYTESCASSIPTTVEPEARLRSTGEGTARQACAAAAYAVMLAAQDPAENISKLAGDEAFCLAELAAEMPRPTGKAAGYKDLPAENDRQVLIGAGPPEPLTALPARGIRGGFVCGQPAPWKFDRAADDSAC